MATILVVEDESDVAAVVATALRGAGHRVLIAGGYAEARRQLVRGAVDAMVADMVLPDGSGADLAHTADGAGVAVVLMTGHPEQLATLAAQGRPFLAKPFRMSRLVTLVRRAIAAKR